MNNIASERKRLGMTQQQLADSLEVGRMTILDIEAGRRECKTKYLCKMADMFKCTTDYLLGRTDERI